jgi:hypothetical protein
MRTATAGFGTPKFHDQRSDQRRVHQKKAQVVYFCMVTTPEYPDRPPTINIGETENHLKRFKEHEKPKHGIKFKIDPLAVVKGTRDDEQQVLRYFKAHRLPGDREFEVFSPHEELVDYIRWLRDQYFVWVPDCDQCAPVEETDSVDAALWMPTPERRKKGKRMRRKTSMGRP